jgi:hypothetical protein
MVMVPYTDGSIRIRGGILDRVTVVDWRLPGDIRLFYIDECGHVWTREILCLVRVKLADIRKCDPQMAERAIISNSPNLNTTSAIIRLISRLSLPSFGSEFFRPSYTPTTPKDCPSACLAFILRKKKILAVALAYSAMVTRPVWKHSDASIRVRRWTGTARFFVWTNLKRGQKLKIWSSQNAESRSRGPAQSESILALPGRAPSAATQ